MKREVLYAMPSLVIAVAVWCLLAASCGVENGAPPMLARCPAAGCELAEPVDVDYSPTEEATVYAPTAEGLWPLVIVVHGITQSRQEFAAVARGIAEQGAVVFNLDVPDKVPFADTVQHIACAVSVARETAKDYGGDPGRVTLVGNSLGAATGLAAALSHAAPGESRCTGGQNSTVIDALVGFEGPYDYATHDYQAVNLIPLRETEPETWTAINPYSHIGGHPDLLVRLVHGVDTDDIWYEVPTHVSVDLHETMLDAGYDAELTLIDGATHVDLRPGTDTYDVVLAHVRDVTHP